MDWSGSPTDDDIAAITGDHLQQPHLGGIRCLGTRPRKTQPISLRSVVTMSGLVSKMRQRCTSSA